MKKPTYSVRLTGGDLCFCASHFIIFQANEHRENHFKVMEPLHGHNFRVQAQITGPLNQWAYVVDFVAARRVLLGILNQLEQKIILPKDRSLFHYVVSDSEVEVLSLHDSRRWIFPAQDVFFLDGGNITAETLVEWIGRKFFQAMEQAGEFFAPQEEYSLNLTLEEANGMIAEVVF